MLVQIYLARARDFLKGVDLVDQESEYRYSSALLAIHGAISYSDALRCGLGSTNLAADDHRSASKEVRKLLDLRGYDRQQGLLHLEKLLGRKTFVSYGGDEMRMQEAKEIVERARRFITWADRVGTELHIQGWRNEAT